MLGLVQGMKQIENDLRNHNPSYGQYSRIWLLDLARTLPFSALDGVDISANQYPCKEMLPKNVSLQELDTFAPLPDHLIEKYDVVHVRLFYTIVRGNDASPLVSNLVRMLSK